MQLHLGLQPRLENPNRGMYCNRKLSATTVNFLPQAQENLRDEQMDVTETNYFTIV